MDTRNAAPSGQFDRQTTLNKVMWCLELQEKMRITGVTIAEIVADEITALEAHDLGATSLPAEEVMAYATSSDDAVPQVSSLPQVEVKPIDESFLGAKVGNAQINSNVGNGPGYLRPDHDMSFSGCTVGDGAVINSGCNNNGPAGPSIPRFPTAFPPFPPAFPPFPPAFPPFPPALPGFPPAFPGQQTFSAPAQQHSAREQAKKETWWKFGRS